MAMNWPRSALTGVWGLGAILVMQRHRAGDEGLACFTELRRTSCRGCGGARCKRAACPRQRLNVAWRSSVGHGVGGGTGFWARR